MDEPDILNDLDQLRSRYDVLRQLGHDGGCAVYAVRGRDSDRHFAVKVMANPGPGSARVGTLHPWQAHTMERLDHPGIIVLHAVHYLQGGTLALAMERRRGRTLAERMEEVGPLPVAEAESVLREVAEALAYLHGRSVVHRGVNPDSILLDRDAGGARLAPFAIVRGGGDRTAVADGAALLRRMAYLAPEQVDGGAPVDGRDVSARSDIYSLGRVGYAMLAGREPGADPDAPLPPLETVRPDAPAYLCRAIEGCLESDPRRRWCDAEELLARLDPAAEHRPAPARGHLLAVRGRAEGAAAAVRAILAGRLPRIAPRNLALTVPAAIIALVAWSVVRTSDAPAPPPAADGPEVPAAAAFRAAHRMASAEAPPPTGEGSPATARAPSSGEEHLRASWNQLEQERPDDVAPAPSRSSASPRGRAPRRATGRTAPAGLVLLGDPVDPTPLPPLLGEQIGPSDRRR